MKIPFLIVLPLGFIYLLENIIRKRETCYWPLAAIIFVGNVPDSVMTKTTMHVHGHCVVRAIGSVSDQRSFVEMVSGDDFLSSKNQA